MIDESTDVGSTKSLAIVVRCFYEGAIGNYFYRLIETSSGTASALFDLIKKALEDDAIPMTNIISYASDGAANVSGRNLSVGSLLEQSQPNIFRMK